MPSPTSKIRICFRPISRTLLLLAAILNSVATTYRATAQSGPPRSRVADPQSQILPKNRLIPRSTGSPTADISRTCPVQRACTINPLFAIGMKCDGVTDDSAALQAALNNAADPGLGSTKIVLPPGTCIVDPAAAITIDSALWLQGSGRNGTHLKRKDSSAGGALLTLNSNGITLSDFAIDGNKGGIGIAAPADSVSVRVPSSGVTIDRVHFLNATGSDIASLSTGANIFVSDWLITNSDFDNGGTPQCAAAVSCANILLRQPQGVTILGNRSDSSQHFAIFSSNARVGQVNVSQNIVTKLNGYGVSLGGGVSGAADAHIHDNFITSLASDGFNLIDVGFWTDFSVNHNILYHNGQVTALNSTAISCIADFPPAYRGTIDSNMCYLLPTAAIDVYGIQMGGDDISITNNFVDGASTAGISYNVSPARAVRGVRIIGNTTKNNSQRTPGVHAGIELHLGTGGANLAQLADVLILSNHSYDDQAKKTQGYGIGVTLAGKLTNVFNVTIQGNDVAGNMNTGVLNSSVSLPGFVIHDNFGYNPVGAFTPVPFPVPSSGPITNTTGIDSTIFVTSGTSPINIAINGVPIKGLTIPGGGIVGSPIRLAANQSITLSYVAGGALAPSWQWIGD
jgi:Pectate lyase superfamily protein